MVTLDNVHLYTLVCINDLDHYVAHSITRGMWSQLSIGTVTNLPTHQYLETITLTKKQVFTLSEDKEWVTWCEENYPQYFN